VNITPAMTMAKSASMSVKPLGAGFPPAVFCIPNFIQRFPSDCCWFAAAVQQQGCHPASMA
jgi:hypothetical protein